MRREMGEIERVCVTGAGGYVASWLVKLLLSKGYSVHGTVRDPCAAKNDHLKKLDNADESLKLVKADLLDLEGLCDAVSGCVGVFHVSLDPVPNPELHFMEPSVVGTRNVLSACSKAGVKKLVVVSSAGAVVNNPNSPRDGVVDEECWSDLEYCKANKKWYSLAKTAAEMEAIQCGKKNQLNIITLCPSYVIGPMLQSTINATSSFFLKFLKDTSASVDFGSRPLVDVRDVAEALVLVYESQEAEGRYICSSHGITTSGLVEKLNIMYPQSEYICSISNEKTQLKMSSEKLQKLGWKIRPLEETIEDAIKSYEEKGAYKPRSSSS